MRLFILFLTLLFPVIASGQDFRNEIFIESGEKIRNSPRRTLPEVLGHDASGGLYALQSRSKSFFSFKRGEAVVHYLQYFDPQLKLAKAKRLNMNYQETPLKYQFVVQLQGTLYLFSSYYNNDVGKEFLMAQEVETESLIPGEAFEVAAVDNPDKDGFFSYELSEKGNRLLLTHTKWKSVTNEKSVDLFVMDEQLEQLWHKKNGLTQKDSSFNVEQYEIDNGGNVYLLTTSFSDERAEKRKGAPDYQYFLFTFRNGGKEKEAYGIWQKNKFITDLQIKLNNEQDIVAGGFYADEESFDVKGACFFTFDVQLGEMTTESVVDFKQEFLQGEGPQMEQSRKSGKRVRKYGLSLNDILLRKDGSAVLLAEQYSVSSGSIFYRRWKKAKSNLFYDVNDIMLVSVDATGEIEWTKRIEKAQHSKNDGGIYASYAPLLQNGDLYFMYNSFPFSAANNSEGKRRRSAQLNLIRVDQYGTQESLEVPNFGERNVKLMPKTAYYLGKQALIMLAEGKNSNCFLKVKVQKNKVLSIRSAY